jgi:hypothetical protein
MKPFITFLFITFSLQFFAQSHILVKHNGDKINVNYLRTNNNTIFYNSSKNQVEETISTFAIAELIDKSTNTAAKISDKVVVSGAEDYNKVVIIDPNQTSGLFLIKNSLKFDNRVKGQSPLSVKQRNEMALKRRAAKDGIPFVSLIENNRRESSAKMYSY